MWKKEQREVRKVSGHFIVSQLCQSKRMGRDSGLNSTPVLLHPLLFVKKDPLASANLKKLGDTTGSWLNPWVAPSWVFGRIMFPAKG